MEQLFKDILHNDGALFQQVILSLIQTTDTLQLMYTRMIVHKVCYLHLQ